MMDDYGTEFATYRDLAEVKLTVQAIDGKVDAILAGQVKQDDRIDDLEDTQIAQGRTQAAQGAWLKLGPVVILVASAVGIRVFG